MTASERPGSRELPWLIAFLVLMLITVLAVWFPVMRSFAHVEINYNEGWNAYRQKMAADGAPLYGSPPLYSVTNYPPLSFHFIGFLGKHMGSVLDAGRDLSLLSIVAIALLIAAIVRHFTGHWLAGTYAALSFVIWMGLFQPGRIGMNDPQFFATVFALLGLYAYVSKPQSSAWLSLSAVAFAVSLFTKHNLLDFPLAVGAHLLFTRAYRRLAVWIAVFGAAAGILLLITLRVDGPYFFAHLTAARPYTSHDALYSIGNYLQAFQIPVAVGMVWALWNRSDASRGLLVLALLFTHAIAFAFSGGYGVDYNIYFDAIIVLMIVLGVAANDVCETAQAHGFGNLMRTAILLAPVAGMLPPLSSRIVLDPLAAQQLDSAEDEFTQAVAFVAARPGAALCHNLLVCFEAGKPEEAMTYFLSSQIGIGKLSESELLNLIDTYRYRTIELETNGGSLQSPGRGMDGIANEISVRYRVALRSGRYALLIPATE